MRRAWKLLLVVNRVVSEDRGQDLIEYALVIVMIAFAAAAGMQGVAGNINNAFGTIGNKLTSYVGT